MSFPFYGMLSLALLSTSKCLAPVSTADWPASPCHLISMMLKSHPLGCSIPLSGKLQLMAPFLKCLRPIEWALRCDGKYSIVYFECHLIFSYLISDLLLFLFFYLRSQVIFVYMQDADKEYDALLLTILNFKADNLLIWTVSIYNNILLRAFSQTHTIASL